MVASNIFFRSIHLGQPSLLPLLKYDALQITSFHWFVGHLCSYLLADQNDVQTHEGFKLNNYT